MNPDNALGDTAVEKAPGVRSQRSRAEEVAAWTPLLMRYLEGDIDAPAIERHMEGFIVDIGRVEVPADATVNDLYRAVGTIEDLWSDADGRSFTVHKLDLSSIGERIRRVAGERILTLLRSAIELTDVIGADSTSSIETPYTLLRNARARRIDVSDLGLLLERRVIGQLHSEVESILSQARQFDTRNADAPEGRIPTHELEALRALRQRMARYREVRRSVSSV